MKSKCHIAEEHTKYRYPLLATYPGYATFLMDASTNGTCLDTSTPEYELGARYLNLNITKMVVLPPGSIVALEQE